MLVEILTSCINSYMMINDSLSCPKAIVVLHKVYILMLYTVICDFSNRAAINAKLYIVGKHEHNTSCYIITYSLVPGAVFFYSLYKPDAPKTSTYGTDTLHCCCNRWDLWLKHVAPSYKS